MGRTARAHGMRAAKLLGELETLRDELTAVEKERARLMKRRDALMVRAADAGATHATIARASGVTRGRVSQLAPTAAPERPARVERQAPGELRIPAGVPLLSGHESRRVSPAYGVRPTVFARIGDDARQAGAVYDDGRPAGVLDVLHPDGILAWCARAGVARLFVYGGELGTTMPGDSRAAQLRAWAQLVPGDGWRVGRGGHYLSDTDTPVFRWEHDERGAVELHTMTAWCGELDDEPATVAAAWRALSSAIGKAFGARVLSTPATTGRDLWARTIPNGRGWPVLSDELRELIAATSGQGRSELIAKPTPRAKLDGLTYLDGRFMYAALTWGLPVGAPTLHAFRSGTDDAAMRVVLDKRGRWLVRATVPAGWAHVGILPATDGSTWRYPRTPGESFTTWCDASEARLALAHGWHVELVEGMTFAEGKPLDTWRDKLVSAWAELDGSAERADRIAARMVRAIVLHAVGAFATRAHRVTRTVPEADAAMVPAGAAVRVIDDAAGRLLTWDEVQPLSAWALNLAHPEWSAQVWARARVRLLDAPAVEPGQRVGALHLPPASVVAFRTDAVYLSGEAPAWTDDGKPGRFRVKGRLTGPRPWPTSLGELFALRDAAELEHERNAT